MSSYLIEWLNLLGRWLHLVAGIAWIGASFYFVWLDNHLLPLTGAQPAARLSGEVSGEIGGESSGDVWAVHGGGFYNARKYPAGPSFLPEPLHWFKWEAY